MKFEIQHMTVEYLEKPLAVDTSVPRFGWWIESKEQGLLQTAYRICVFKDDELYWDSKKVVSDCQFHIEYEGKKLQPLSAYKWELTVYNQDNETATKESTFETGFLGETNKAFPVAKWIGSPQALPLYANYLSVFGLEMEFIIPKGAYQAGFYYGADDPRLMNRNMNLLEVENASGDSYVKIVIDISPIKKGNPATLAAYRAGYSLNDHPERPLYMVEIPETLLNKDNCHDVHRIIMTSVYGEADFYLDKVDSAHTMLSSFTGNLRQDRMRRWNLNPIGRGGDYISFPVVGKIGIYANEEAPFICRDFKIRNYRAPHGVLYSGVPDKINQFYDISHGANAMFRRSFSIEKKPKRARIYATARGVYNLYLNGLRVSEDYLAPGLSQYDKHQYYQAFDVTERINQGENCLGAVLAEGWFSGSISFTGENWNYFGEKNSLLLELYIEYEDGTRDVFASDPEQFLTDDNGPVIYSSIFQGEVYDCRREHILQEFTLPSFDVHLWKPSVVVPCDETNCCLKEDIETIFGTSQPGLDYSDLKLLAQPDVSVRESEHLTAISLLKPRPGVYIYDMGQNMAGIPCVTIQGKEGQEIVMRYAEVLYPELNEYSGKSGTMMLENIRSAMATDRFILRDGLQILKPMFTYHGYRYVEITGLDEPLELSCVKGISLSSIPKLSTTFSCSDSLINRLYQNIGWSLRGNFISIPSDCPQRNERMGWSGDLSVFARTAVYMSDSEPFLMRHMAALRDTQQNGRFADITPIGGGFGGTLWGSAGITVPWEMYLQYGDRRVLEEMFPAMYDYVRFLSGKKDKNGIVKEGPLGDWLGPENSKNESAFLWQSYYVYDLYILCQCAEILNKIEEKLWLNKEYNDALSIFNRFYIDSETGLTVYSDYTAAMSLNSPFTNGIKKKEPQKLSSGKYSMDTQTSYAVALGLNLLKGTQKEKAEEYLNRACSRGHVNDWNQKCPPYTLMTGFIGTSWISQALSNAGFHETAWKMLKSKEYPSWLYPVTNGATTIWERLNSYTPEAGFGGNNSMNSFNHYSFGAVAAWMLGYAGGVRRDGNPGSFAICPVPDPSGEVTFASCKVQTVQGEYQVSWKIEKENTIYSFHIPGGKKTRVELPLQSKHQQDRHSLENIKGIEKITYNEHSVSFVVFPGDYTISL